MGTLIQSTKSAWLYARVAVSLVIADRGLLLTDLILATATPFLAQAVVWTFIYNQSGNGSIQGLALSGTLFYFAFAIVMGRMNNGYGIIEGISDALYSGRLEVLLIRPFSYPMQKLADFIGGSFVYMLPVSAVMIVHAIWLKGEVPLSDPLYFLGVMLLIFTSQILCFTISFLIGLLSFKTVRADLVLALQSVTSAFFGGILLPPEFWPQTLRPIMEFNPYRFMIAAPAEVCVTKDWQLLFASIGYSSCYSVLFAGFSWLLWKKLTKNYSSVGG